MNKNDSRSPNALFQSLADGDRRRLLGLLYDRAPDPVAREELATRLAAEREGKPRGRVTEEERQRALSGLHHVHLPKLEAAGLIERDVERNEVTVTDHPAFEDPDVVAVLGDRADADSRSLDALFEALADARRRTVLDVLSHQYQPIQEGTLAREVVASERGTPERDVTAEAVERALVSLRHAHLPRLREAGLIDWDADEQLVEYEGHPSLCVPWMHSVLRQDFRASLTGESETQEVGTIEGREGVVSYGQSLCEAADEELFLMFTATGLLEAGCFTRIRRAVDRGVDVYLGTRDPAVREFVRERAPEATLWKPQENWLDLPVEEDNVGRLVFADRETVMLGTLGEKDQDGVHEERAIVGEGADNTLVVMLRQLLGSRLEQFDREGESLPAELLF